MSKAHYGKRTRCTRCGGSYCVKCDSSCPSCCLHEDCIAAKRERDEALLRGTTFERWFKAAVKHHNDLIDERDEARAEAAKMRALLKAVVVAAGLSRHPAIAEARAAVFVTESDEPSS